MQLASQRREMTDKEWVDIQLTMRREFRQFRTKCFSVHPHYALLLTRLGDEFVRSGRYMGRSLPTAATDGKNIYVNATWWKDLPKESRWPLFLHELLHNVLGHSYRRGDRNHKLWNMACDYVINAILKEMGYYIPDWLYDEKYKGMSEERVYAKLLAEQQTPKQPPKPPQPPGEPCEDGEPGTDPGEPDPENPDEGDQEPDQEPEDEPSSGDEEGDQPTEGEEEGDEPTPDDDEAEDEPSSGEESQGDSPGEDNEGEAPAEDDYDAPGQIWDPTTPEGNPLDEDEIAEKLAEIAKDLEEAQTVSKTSGRGFEPRGQRAIERLTRPKLDWRSYLNKWIAKRGQVCGRSWGKLDRRSLQRGDFRPGEVREGIDWLVVAVDISSSISWGEFEAFMEHLDKIRSNVKIQRLTILPFNEIVTTTQIIELKPGDPTPKTLRTGGGTCFSPIFNWVRREKGRPDGVIVFTDLGSTDWGQPPTCSVLWASTDEVYTGYDGWYSNKPPFGETMQIDLS